MAQFDATTAREMLMEFFDDDGSDKGEVLLDLEKVLIDQNGEIIRTEDIIQTPSNRIFEEDEDWSCAQIIKISMIGKSNNFFWSLSYHSIFACPIPIILMGNA